MGHGKKRKQQLNQGKAKQAKDCQRFLSFMVKIAVEEFHEMAAGQLTMSAIATF